MNPFDDRYSQAEGTEKDIVIGDGELALPLSSIKKALGGDTSTLATKQELSDGLAGKADKSVIGDMTLIPESNLVAAHNNLKSSVSNGKLSVRDAITGKGGTVSDADGDGIPSFSELQAGVNGIKALRSFIYPNTSGLSTDFILSQIDLEEGKIYGYDPYGTNAYIFDLNGNILQTITSLENYQIRGFNKYALIQLNNASNPYGYRAIDLNGTVIASLSNSTLFDKIYFDKNKNRFITSTTGSSITYRTFNLSGTQLYSLSLSGDTTSGHLVATINGNLILMDINNSLVFEINTINNTMIKVVTKHPFESWCYYLEAKKGVI